MKMIKTALSAAAIAAVSFSVQAATCSDIELSSKYEGLKGFCTNVVTKDGQNWAHMKAKVVQTRSDKLKVKFQNPDGSYSNTFQSKELPENFRTYINGKETAVGDLKHGQKLDFFIKTQ